MTQIVLWKMNPNFSLLWLHKLFKLLLLNLVCVTAKTAPHKEPAVLIGIFQPSYLLTVLGNISLYRPINPAVVMFSHEVKHLKLTGELFNWAEVDRNSCCCSESFQLTYFQGSILGKPSLSRSCHPCALENSPRNNRSSSIRWAWGAAAPDLLQAGGKSHSLSAKKQQQMKAAKNKFYWEFRWNVEMRSWGWVSSGSCI